MDDPVTERLTRIETHLAHVERLCDELNAVVTGQARELERLRKRMALLTESLEQMELDRVKATNPKPPHYQ
jgi:SlyX protein